MSAFEKFFVFRWHDGISVTYEYSIRQALVGSRIPSTIPTVIPIASEIQKQPGRFRFLPFGWRTAAIQKVISRNKKVVKKVPYDEYYYVFGLLIDSVSDEVVIIYLRFGYSLAEARTNTLLSVLTGVGEFTFASYCIPSQTEDQDVPKNSQHDVFTRWKTLTYWLHDVQQNEDDNYPILTVPDDWVHKSERTKVSVATLNWIDSVLTYSDRVVAAMFAYYIMASKHEFTVLGLYPEYWNIKTIITNTKGFPTYKALHKFYEQEVGLLEQMLVHDSLTIRNLGKALIE